MLDCVFHPTPCPRQECWQLRKGCKGVREEEVEFEEELYAAGTVVVWSQGSRTGASAVYKAFTVDGPVQQVGPLRLWSQS